jgi:hypothetical protein
MLKELIASNPGMQVTPQVAIAFIAEKTKHSPPQSPPMDEEELPRGREEERDYDDSHSRSSSSDSVGTHRNHSRPPSRGAPQTPKSASSPFDTSRRQRSTPLGGVAAPSSWAKRPPHHRRKSDAGSRSDSEVRHFCLHFSSNFSLLLRSNLLPVPVLLVVPPVACGRPPTRPHPRAA